MKGQEVLSKTSSEALNTNISHLPAIKHNLTSSISASPPLHLPTSFQGPFYPKLHSGNRKQICFISSLTTGLKAACLWDCVYIKGARSTYMNAWPWSARINLQMWLPVHVLPSVAACVHVKVWEDNIMHLHAVLQSGRMALIYNHDERSVHLIKQHIGILLHSIG